MFQISVNLFFGEVHYKKSEEGGNGKENEIEDNVEDLNGCCKGDHAVEVFVDKGYGINDLHDKTGRKENEDGDEI